MGLWVRGIITNHEAVGNMTLNKICIEYDTKTNIDTLYFRHKDIYSMYFIKYKRTVHGTKQSRYFNRRLQS